MTNPPPPQDPQPPHRPLGFWRALLLVILLVVGVVLLVIGLCFAMVYVSISTHHGP